MNSQNCKPIQAAKKDFTKLYIKAKKIVYGKHQIGEA
jgi:hypothetical protein